MTSKPLWEVHRDAREYVEAADALCAKHERIGRLVCENKVELSILALLSARSVTEGSAMHLLGSILAEVDKP